MKTLTLSEKLMIATIVLQAIEVIYIVRQGRKKYQGRHRK
ncbi:hypothetical protein GCM10009615_03960 [Corynebacterium durum]